MPAVVQVAYLSVLKGFLSGGAKSSVQQEMKPKHERLTAFIT